MTDQATNESRNTVTSSAGEYVFNAVDPAAYSLFAELPSFKRPIWLDILVATQEVFTSDIQMKLGAVSRTVEGTKEVPIIESFNASNEQVMDAQKLTDLPNPGCNPFLLTKLLINVEPVGDPCFNQFQNQSFSSQISVAGGLIRGNNVRTWDSSLFKNFTVPEPLHGEFRAEALNTFNSPQFANPVTKVGNNSFGVISNPRNFPGCCGWGYALPSNGSRFTFSGTQSVSVLF